MDRSCALEVSTKSEEEQINVVLLCTETNATRQGTVGLRGPEGTTAPGLTLSALKERVEAKFSIPACVQTLTCEGYGYGDRTTLEKAGLRAGDSVHVSYSSEGDCKEIDEVVRWFQEIRQILGMRHPAVSSYLSYDLDELLRVGISEEWVEKLAFEYLFPWENSRKYANKLHFVSCGGLEAVMEIYAILHRCPWNRCPVKLKYLEYGILRILWNLSETFALRRQILRHDGLSLCIASLLRQKLEEGEAIEDKVEESNQPTFNWLLVENIGGALGLLCK